MVGVGNELHVPHRPCCISRSNARNKPSQLTDSSISRGNPSHLASAKPLGPSPSAARPAVAERSAIRPVAASVCLDLGAPAVVSVPLPPV